MNNLCNCAECQRLDALPVRLHGVPHAKQISLLNGPVATCKQSLQVQLLSNAQQFTRPQASWESLPLFTGGLQPTLL